MGVPADQNITIATVVAGIVTCLIAGILHFAITTCLELVAFWQDVIWNLMVMLRFIVMLLGGGMIPIAFFPEWGQKLVALTPFPALIAFPVRTFLGQVTLGEWFSNIGVLAFWTVIFAGLAAIIWNRGVRQYSGVGI
jgi:ABC-2 type transport system permease protein